MKQIVIIIIAFWFMGATNWMGLGQNQASANIRGQVYMQNMGILLSRAEVRILANGSEIRHVYTDSNGFYKFDDLPSGIYEINVELTGFSSSRNKIKLQDGEHLLLNIGLEIGRNHVEELADEIVGEVTSSDNTPLPDATVIALNPFNQEVLAKTITNSTGRYTMRPSGNNLVIYAIKPGFLVKATSHYFNKPWPRGPHKVDFKLVPLPLINTK